MLTQPSTTLTPSLPLSLTPLLLSSRVAFPSSFIKPFPFLSLFPHSLPSPTHSVLLSPVHDKTVCSGGGGVAFSGGAGYRNSCPSVCGGGGEGKRPAGVLDGEEERCGWTGGTGAADGQRGMLALGRRCWKREEGNLDERNATCLAAGGGGGGEGGGRCA